MGRSSRAADRRRPRALHATNSEPCALLGSGMRRRTSPRRRGRNDLRAFLVSSACRAPEPRRKAHGKARGLPGRNARWISALNPSWLMFSRSREKTRRRSEKAWASPWQIASDFPGAGGQQAHEGPSRSRLPRALPHSRRRGDASTQRNPARGLFEVGAEHHGPGGYDGRRPQITSKFRPPAPRRRKCETQRWKPVVNVLRPRHAICVCTCLGS